MYLFATAVVQLSHETHTAPEDLANRNNYYQRLTLFPTKTVRNPSKIFAAVVRLAFASYHFIQLVDFDRPFCVILEHHIFYHFPKSTDQYHE